jgi:hypothetical protein
MESIGKQEFFSYQDEDKIIEGDEALKKYITSYYKGLFGGTNGK